MTPGGALVEAAILPAVGAMVQLVRGRLIAYGLVIWVRGDRCGLKFTGSADVDHWRAALVNSEQQRVDQIVGLVKAGAVPLDPSRSFRRPDNSDEDAETLLSDFARVSGLLEALGAALSKDAIIAANYGSALQNLDIATQLIGAMSSAKANTGERNASLPSIRRSADQALGRR